MSWTTLKLTLPYPPQVNHFYTVARGRKILSTKGREYKNGVGKQLMAERVRPTDGNVRITFTAYRPRKIGDLDNLLKPVLDSLKGFAFDDDKQVIEIHAIRKDDKDDPRIDMVLERI
jgi:crossover junction endodeoxyribonuclease RusA